MKTCLKCQETKPLDMFSVQRKERHSSWCKSCHNTYSIAHHALHKPPKPDDPLPEGLKRCITCKEVKLDGVDFHRQSKSKCILCYRQYHRDRNRRLSPEEKRALYLKTKKRRRLNPEKFRKYAREYQRRRKEESRRAGETI